MSPPRIKPCDSWLDAVRRCSKEFLRTCQRSDVVIPGFMLLGVAQPVYVEGQIEAVDVILGFMLLGVAQKINADLTKRAIVVIRGFMPSGVTQEVHCLPLN